LKPIVSKGESMSIPDDMVHCTLCKQCIKTRIGKLLVTECGHPDLLIDGCSRRTVYYSMRKTVPEWCPYRKRSRAQL
jgi:hypothetical protein